MTCGITSEWNTLLGVEAGAAATLTGLIFVAVSLNLSRILSIAGLSGRAAEAMLQLLEVFFVSTLALVPGQPTNVLAMEILAVGILFWMVQTVALIRHLRKRPGHYPWSWFLYRAALSQLATVPFCIAGVTLLLGVCAGVYWLVPGALFSFAAAMMSAWVLLVEILR